MGLTHSTEVETPVDVVFGWHERPGAITRLTPPWQPVRVITESASLRDGFAELSLPGPARWVARHDAEAYDPPHRFADELAGGLLGSALHWRHSHEFSAVSDAATRVTDQVDTQVPAAMLRPTFEYRHRQLADDLAAQQRVRQHDDQNLTVAVTGSSGLIGRALTALLSTAGHTVIRLVRHRPDAPDQRHWNPSDPASDLLDGVDAVVHLAGSSIAGRLTPQRKRLVFDSRVGPTGELARAAARSGVTTFVSSSAIGYYGADRGDEPLTESSPPGDGFLAKLVTEWEADCEAARLAGLRVVHVRTGVVQSPAGGMLQVLRPIFSAGLGGRIGDGLQWTAWIGIDDLVDIYHRALLDTSMVGPVNAVAPNPLRNDEYTRTLARVVRRPAALPVPDVGPRLVLGNEGASEIAYANQRVRPHWLTEHDHKFRHPTLDSALAHVLGRRPLV